MQKIVLLCSLLILSLMGLCVLSYMVYTKTGHLCKIELSDAFDVAIKKEKQERWRWADILVHSSYDPRVELSGQIEIQTESGTIIHQRNDSIDFSFNDFLEKTQHTYLAQKYPLDLQVLDSIFRDELKSRGISAQTAVTYMYMDGIMQKSRADSAFFTSSRQTEEIVLGAMDEIRLSANQFLLHYYDKEFQNPVLSNDGNNVS